MQRKKTTTPASVPSTPPLIAPPSNRTGSTPLLGEEPQGPSLVDYELELEADFPLEMVLEMQKGVVCKARRMVIGRALGGRPTIKALQDCLKLHLLASYTSTTLLTRGFFEVLFTDEEGAKLAKKITTVDWSGLNLSFSQYIPNFNASVQGAETLLSHTIKVQGPIPRSSRAIQKHKSSHYHGQKKWRISRNRTRGFIHRKTRWPLDHSGNP
jgi:hypothetical protein